MLFSYWTGSGYAQSYDTDFPFVDKVAKLFDNLNNFLRNII